MGRVPEEAEEIEVRFQLSSGAQVWWPGTVENVRKSSEPGVVAEAEIMYHAAHDYQAERRNVRFLGNHLLRTQTSSWTDSTWKFPEQDAEENSSVQSEEIQERPVKKSQRTTLSLKGVDCQADIPVRKRRSSESISPRTLQRSVHTLQHRVAKLESLIDLQSKCNHAELIDERVRAFKNVMSDEVVRSASTVPRPTSAVTLAPFGNALLQGCASHSIKCDYKMFRYIVQDLRYRFQRSSTLMFMDNAHPAVGATLGAEQHIVFPDCCTFFNWLGMNHSMDIPKVLIEHRQNTRTGNEVLRVMGGLQWDPENFESSITLFVGRSCSSTITTGRREEATSKQMKNSLFFNEGKDDESSQEDHVPELYRESHPCISYDNSQWDETNMNFVAVPTELRKAPGVPKAEQITNTFSLSWEAVPPFSHRKYGHTPVEMEGVRLGYITVRYPYVLVRGIGVCSKIRSLLTYDFLQRCTI